MTAQTIVDVARQAETSPHGFAYLEGKDPYRETLLFCINCEASNSCLSLYYYIPTGSLQVIEVQHNTTIGH